MSDATSAGSRSPDPRDATSAGSRSPNPRDAPSAGRSRFGMTSAIALARAELLALARDRVAAFNAVVLPLVGATYLVVNPPPADEVPGTLAAAGAAVVLALFTGATVVLKSVVTLVHRREQHLLERWRISGAAPAAILTGTLAPGLLLMVAGTTVMFAALGVALDDPPAQPAPLVLAVVLAAALGGAAATLAAAFARTSDAAGVVALPILGGLVGGAMWTTLVPLGEITWRMRATGGGALAEVVRVAWEGPVGGGGGAAALVAAGPSVLVLVGATAAMALAATRTFRWQTRA